jgi:hypothetical protein
MVGPDEEPRAERAEQAPALPGHFVSAAHRTDLARFLDEVRTLVEHRLGGQEETEPPQRGT